MAAQMRKTKYEPLQDYLQNLPSNKTSIRMSFADIEDIIGASLPRSAHLHRPWWANQRDSKGRPQAHAWLSAGFKVTNVQQTSKRGSVEFHRGRV